MFDEEEKKLKDKNEAAIMHQINSNSDIIAKKI